MHSMVPAKRSLKTKIILATLAVLLLGIWSLAFYVARMLQRDMEDLLEAQQFSTVSMVAAQINRELEERLETLERAAQAIGTSGRTRPDELQSLLEQRFDVHAQFNGGGYIVDTQGRAVADYPLSMGRRGGEYLDREYIATPLREARSVIGVPVIGKKAKAPVIVMAAPIKNTQGQVRGALTGVISLDRPNFFDQVTESRFGKTGGFLLVVPEQRLVATATNKARIMEVLPPPGVNAVVDRFIEGFEGTQIGLNPYGVHVLASAKRVPINGWYVTITMPSDEAFAPIVDMQRRMLIATLALTVVVGLWIGWLLRRQLAPLLDTARSLVEMSDTRRAVHALPVTRSDEIGELVSGFNRLLAVLSQREHELRESHETLRSILATSKDGYWRVDMKHVLLDVNPAYCRLSGYSRDELLGMRIEDLEALKSSLEIDAHYEVLKTSGSQQFETLHRRKDGSVWHVEVSVTYHEAHGGQIFVFMRDISERKQSEEKLYLAASVFSHAREAIMITDARGAIIEVNDSFSRITGYAHDEVVGRNPRLLSSGRHEHDFYASLWRDLEAKGHWYGEIWNRRKNGELFASMQTISAVTDERGRARQYVSLFSDITALKEHEKRLEHIAHYDVLTTLPNRVLLADRLHQAMAQAERRGQSLAVVYLDLDGFKSVNDNYGHQAGDQLLVALSGRMKHSLREGDTLARLGGDEFIAVLLDLGLVSESMPMLDRLLVAAAQPVELDGQVFQVSASLGVTFFPQAEPVDADQLLRQADQAMYQAKLSGKNRYHFFDTEHDRNVRGHHESIEHIRNALNAGEFVLYYQPKVNMRTGEVIGAEALIRWQHPERGLLAPSVFLPVVENHPLGVEIGEWVIESALLQIERWREGGLELPVSVNIGARQLLLSEFSERMREILAAHPAYRHGDLELEVLETSALEDMERVSAAIEACRSMGVGFALDDFGTGYSSLTYLKRLSVGWLKIDQSFVRDMLDDPDDLSILGGVLNMATAFRRQVIAEGVETVAHGTMLLQLGCELAQGFGIARPMPASALPGWVASWRPDPVWSTLPEVSREELPLLFAVVEHRAWVRAVDAFLRGQRETLPLSHHHCRLGEWLDDEEVEPAPGSAADAIGALHRQAHELATELCTLKVDGEARAALARCHELYAVSDSLLQCLQAFVRTPLPVSLTVTPRR